MNWEWENLTKKFKVKQKCIILGILACPAEWQALLHVYLIALGLGYEFFVLCTVPFTFKLLCYLND